MFFSKPFLVFFFNVYFFFDKNDRFGGPSKIRWVPKWRTKSAKWCHNGTGKFTVRLFCFKPCFHEAIVITVSLGHRGFKKVIFSMGIG